MASVVEICNLALQRLGASRITSLTENSPNARSCNACYETLRDAELRAHPWNFANAQVQLASVPVAPLFGKEVSYALPSDYLQLKENYDEDRRFNDWVVEGNYLYSNDVAPLNFRYTKKVTDPNLFDPIFRLALAYRMAMHMCEEITQSNTKVQLIENDYTREIRRAKRANAIERKALLTVDDPWITVRL